MARRKGRPVDKTETIFEFSLGKHLNEGIVYYKKAICGPCQFKSKNCYPCRAIHSYGMAYAEEKMIEVSQWN